MDRLSSEDVKRIAGFLEFKGMVNLSQTRQAYQADLKPLTRKAEMTMMKENGKLKKAVTTLTRALIHIKYNVMDDSERGDNYINDWTAQIVTMVQMRYDMEWYFDRPDPIHLAFDIRNSPGPPPLAYFDGSPEEDNAIIQAFLNEMD